MKKSLPKTPIRFIAYFVKKQWIKFSLLSLCSIVWAFNDAIYPYFLKRIVDTLTQYQGNRAHIFQAVGPTLVLLILCWLMTEIVQRLQGVLQVYTIPDFRANIRHKVFNYTKEHSHDYFSNHFAGSLAKKLADLPTSCQTIMESLCFNFLVAGAGAVLVLGMMWLTHPVFAYILIVWLCLHLGFTFLFLRYTNRLWATHADAVSLLSGKIVDAFNNILTVRLFARGKYESDYLKRFQEDEVNKARKAMRLVEIMRVAMGLSGLSLIFGMIFALLYGYSRGWVTIGDFTQVSMQTFWLLGWIWFTSYQITVFSREMGTIRGALKLITQHHDLVDKPNAKPLVVTRGEIQFKNVTFKYKENTPLFDQLTVTIPAGKKVGLVGFSGSGKSSFVNLILRFYDINGGEILIDGQNIAHVTQNSLRAHISMIPQDPALFHRSLFENIRYGSFEANEKAVIKAAKLAHCHEFITQLDEGYQSLVGERGIKLSGGQRQRIAIARAILKNAPILILDEATSALDSVTEKLIQESLSHLMKHKTTLVVAHRLSTLIDMDLILVFDKGKIIESGSHEELLARDSHFAKLWRMQTDGFLPEEEEEV